MKTFITSFVISLFAVPAAVALFLIFTFLASQVPDLYYALASLALAFSISTMVWGPFWLEPLPSASFWVFPKSLQRTISIQEENYEECFKGHVRS